MQAIHGPLGSFLHQLKQSMFEPKKGLLSGVAPAAVSAYHTVPQIVADDPFVQAATREFNSRYSGVQNPFGHGIQGALLHRFATGIQTHDDAIKNEQDRLHSVYKQGGVGGIDAMTLARQATLHPELSNAMMHANLLALMQHLGYVPYQAR